MNTYHTGVLLQEGVDALKVRKDGLYIDATLGGGSHTGEIIKRGGIVLGIDVDFEAIDFNCANFKKEIADGKLFLARGNFAKIDEIAKANRFNSVLGIIFDLGVSSHQLDTPSRGFSYQKSGPLDMRMDQGLNVKAADLINALGKGELYELFKNFGEEHRARIVSERIISARRIAKISTTNGLVEILAKAYGFNNLSDFAKAESSKRVFQALRIVVNDELESIRKALPISLDLLEKGGRLAVITFHSLEDRIVKHIFLGFEKENLGKNITDKPIIPSTLEIAQNPRSKSAKLRIFEKNI